jgi:TolA-binding protein
MWLQELPAAFRWSLVGAGGLVLLLVAGTGIWAILEQREASALDALTSAVPAYRQAMASRQEADLKASADSLNQLVTDYPRSPVATEAWYLLGNVQYQRRNPDGALQAYEAAAQRDPGSTIAALSRLGIAYAWEAKGDAVRSLEAYEKALQGRRSTDFLYGELLLGKARAQERLGQRPQAIETYRKLLDEVPGFSRAEEARMRLAILTASA